MKNKLDSDGDQPIQSDAKRVKLSSSVETANEDTEWCEDRKENIVPSSLREVAPSGAGDISKPVIRDVLDIAEFSMYEE